MSNVEGRARGKESVGVTLATGRVVKVVPLGGLALRQIKDDDPTETTYKILTLCCVDPQFAIPDKDGKLPDGVLSFDELTLGEMKELAQKASEACGLKEGEEAAAPIAATEG